MSEITLYDTRTRRKETLEPTAVPNKVSLYVCGPTVYDRAHIGNARAVVVFDTLFRLLRHRYGERSVTYVRNFTDVDDKINARAAATKLPGETELAAIRRITDETIGWYHADMDALGALRPTFEPRATEYVGPMIAMIEALIARGHAYVAEGHALFSVGSYPDYGALSRRSLDDMRAGARVEVAPYKRDPMDFVLWKPSDAATPGWDSPWGRGRPGWHIECSAMARDLLGGIFDIHGGGVDLAFPHHENELAQSVCAHPDEAFARLWMHNGMLNVEREKMSKSLGNFFTVRELLDKDVDGQTIRLLLLSTHYRSPLDWTEERLAEAKAKLIDWQSLKRRLEKNGLPTTVDMTAVDPGVVAALSDDLNTPLALNRRMTELAGEAQTGSAAASVSMVSTLHFLGFDLDVLFSAGRRAAIDRAFAAVGLTTDDEFVDLRIETLLRIRTQAREERQFARADSIRDVLVSAGVVIMDRPGAATEYERGPDFDYTKLAEFEPD